LTAGRLVFLAAAVAAVPIVVGVQLLGQASTSRSGVVLLASGATVAILVMVRIGRLSAHQSRVERALRQQATVDPLTGLPNRRTFLDRLTTALSQKRHCVVLFCDIDGFKAINDRWGHAVGDEVLAQVGARLVSAVRAEDTVSRMGGDEFLILLVGPTTANVDTLVARIRATFELPLRLSTGTLAIGLSIGVAAGTTTTAKQLISAADGRMYEAKRAAIGTGPGTHVVAG
jgi:diguanylate cyclase (GGDEF)-like protein